MPTRTRFPARVVAVALVWLVAGVATACVTPRRLTHPAPASVAPASVAPAAVAERPSAPGAQAQHGVDDGLLGAGRAAAIPGAAGSDSSDAARARSGDAAKVRAVLDSARAAEAVLSDMALAEADGAAGAPSPFPVWDLEVEAHASRARVAYFVDAFSVRLNATFSRALTRQTRYSALISDRLRAAGLPQDLTYLALIESWYDPHAYSKAAAVGMWQFMARTARGVGLRVDWWVDERRDPVRATEGAVRLLASLNNEFGSMFLAAAAYNGGSGRVSRGLTQFASRVNAAKGENKFFALSDTRHLRPETRDYVPKLIAAALVAKQPERYALRIDSLAAFAFDSVLVPGGAPLAAVAAATLAPLDSIRDLNSHILRGMVPEGDSMWVRVPVGMSGGFASLYATIGSADRVSVTRVVTRTGESIASIARKNRLTAKQLNWYNPRAARLKSGNLVAGQKILVPSAAVVAAARDVPNPAIERYPARRRASTKRP